MPTSKSPPGEALLLFFPVLEASSYSPAPAIVEVFCSQVTKNPTQNPKNQSTMLVVMQGPISKHTSCCNTSCKSIQKHNLRWDRHGLQKKNNEQRMEQHVALKHADAADTLALRRVSWCSLQSHHRRGRRGRGCRQCRRRSVVQKQNKGL